ncbi:MAG: hypothetical protein M1570_03055 [Chloroflexi bacterium]|nr:hypothetical protein [Chloroflexota bacterium]
MEESFSARPLVGRWLALDLRPTRPLTFLGPGWAVVCGVIASGSLLLRWQTVILVIFSLLLADVLLGAWRAQWLLPDWREAVRRSMSNAPAWFIAPDLETQRRIQRVWRQATRRLHFFRTILWPLIDSEVVGMFMIGVLALSVASVLGQLPLLLCAAAMAIALVEGQLEGERAEWLRAIYEITLPWLIAQAAFGFFSWLSLAFVLLFTLVYRGLLGLSSARQNHWLLIVNLAQLAAALVLFAKGAPAIAGVASLTLLAQVLWQTRYRVSRDGRGYVQRTQSYVLVAMLVTGVALWF